jgi:hypothetical protein
MSWCRAPSGSHDQMFVTVCRLLLCLCCAPSLTKGRICRLSARVWRTPLLTALLLLAWLLHRLPSLECCLQSCYLATVALQLLIYGRCPATAVYVKVWIMKPLVMHFSPVTSSNVLSFLLCFMPLPARTVYLGMRGDGWMKSYKGLGRRSPWHNRVTVDTFETEKSTRCLSEVPSVPNEIRNESLWGMYREQYRSVNPLGEVPSHASDYAFTCLMLFVSVVDWKGAQCAMCPCLQADVTVLDHLNSCVNVKQGQVRCCCMSDLKSEILNSLKHVVIICTACRLLPHNVSVCLVQL